MAAKLLFNMLGAIAEFERDLIADRTAEGREIAKAQGKGIWDVLEKLKKTLRRL